MLVYFSNVLLLLSHVRNKVLLFPDIMLLGAKLVHVFYCAVRLLGAKELAYIGIFTYTEDIAEGISFAAFLVILFVGKL